MADRVRRCANRTGQALLVFLPLLAALGTLVARVEGWNVWRDGWYYGMVCGSTTGFGDLSPHTLAGRLITCYAIMPVGLIGVGVIVGRVAAVVIETGHEYTDDEQKRSEAREAAALDQLAASELREVRTLALLEELAVERRTDGAHSS